jgi:hypothetical protein
MTLNDRQVAWTTRSPRFTASQATAATTFTPWKLNDDLSANTACRRCSATAAVQSL